MPVKQIEGVPVTQWFQRCSEVRTNRSVHGLTPVARPICVGGYCLRHHHSRPVEYSTPGPDRLLLCEECATIWAVRVSYKLPHKIGDL